MPRSVNSVAKRARRKKIIKQAKGYFGRRKNVWTVAKNAVEKAMLYAYRDRRNKKRNFRSLWMMRINAAARLNGLTYSEIEQIMLGNITDKDKIERYNEFNLKNKHKMQPIPVCILPK